MASRTVAILGGGIGGIVAANELRRKLPAEHRVVLVERNAEHAFPPSFLWLMTGDRRPEDIRRPLASLLQKGVEFVHASVEGLDLTRQQVATTAGNIGYDYLIVALGAELAPEAVPGLKEGAETFYTFEGAARLRDVLSKFSGGRVAIVVAAMPYKCPGAPHEGAMLIANYLRKRGLSAKSEVHLITPEPQPMPVAGPQLGTRADVLRERQEALLHTQAIALRRRRSGRAEGPGPGGRWFESTVVGGICVEQSALVHSVQ